MEKFYYVSGPHNLLTKECPYLKVKIGSAFCEEKCAHNHFGRSFCNDVNTRYIECSYKDDHGYLEESKDEQSKEFTDKQLCMIYEKLERIPTYGHENHELATVQLALNRRGIVRDQRYDSESGDHYRFFIKNGKEIFSYRV